MSLKIISHNRDYERTGNCREWSVWLRLRLRFTILEPQVTAEESNSELSLRLPEISHYRRKKAALMSHVISC